LQGTSGYWKVSASEYKAQDVDNDDDKDDTKGDDDKKKSSMLYGLF